MGAQCCHCESGKDTDKIKAKSFPSSDSPKSPTKSPKSPSKAASRRESRRESRRNSASKEAAPKPEENILVQALFADFQESLRSMFKTRKEAYDKLGGSDDGRIEMKELQEFLIKLGYDNKKLNEQLFSYIDRDNDGFITRMEFKILFQGETADLVEFKEQLKDSFKSRQKAFDDLGGADDGKISLEEFSAFLQKQLGYAPGAEDAKIKGLFCAIDADNSGAITKGEFKALFQPQGETAAVIEFKDKLKKLFKTRKQAFDKLGGSDDALIDLSEFTKFLKDELEYQNTEHAEQLFHVIDDNSDGSITKAEFEALFLRHTVKLVEIRESLKEMLREKCKSRQKAFDMLGGEDDSRIDRKELRKFLREQLKCDDEEANEQLFTWIDKDGNGYITVSEFKAFF